MLLELTIVAGDGIGPEVTEEGIRVLEALAGACGHELKLTRKNIGGAALAASNDPLPPDLQSYIVFSAGVSASSKAPDAVRDLIKFLKSPAAVAVMKAQGMEPG